MWNEYKVLRNKVNVFMKDSKAKYYKTEIKKHSDNVNKMWKCLRTLLPTKKDSLPHIIAIDDHLCSDNFIIANAFNDYFIDSVKKCL